MRRELFCLPAAARVTLVLLAVFCLSATGTAGDENGQCPGQKTVSSCVEREKPSEEPSEEASCPAITREKQETEQAEVCVACETLGTSAMNPIPVTIKELKRNPEQYYGKWVTVDADMHDTFTDTVFSVEQGGRELLVINPNKQCEAVIGLDKDRSTEKGKLVRITGVAEPYDCEKLEAEYGPLNLGRHADNSFTEAPAVIVKPMQTASMAPLATAELEKPAEPAPAPEPEVAAPAEPEAAAPVEPEVIEEEAVVIEEESLPRTASDISLLGFVGLLALGAAISVRRYRAE
jgi:hypothetical protein